MPHALLLSPDDQAVTAITGVLEEMSVTCERPLDGASAAQKLNSQSFDLVLVDCENLPAAKLIFDVCRRGKNGNNPVPIAIVDGRAGLPTAFRLGAELILTKPVAKDQARGTIRTAVSRVRKTVPANESATAQVTSATPASAATSNTALPEHAQSAVAAAVSSQLTNFAEPGFAEPAPSLVSSSLPSAAAATASAAASTATFTAPALTTKMHSAVDEIDAPPATPESIPTAPAESRSTRPFVPSDDPVLAELERMELEESQPAAPKPDSQKPSAGLNKAAPEPATAKTEAPVFSSYPQRSRKTRAPLVALLMLAVAGGGFYAAWTYQPGFRVIVQPQIDRVLELVGMATTPAASPAKPAAHLAPTGAPVPPSPSDSNQAPVASADSGINAATGPTDGSATTFPAAPVSAKLPAGNTAVVTPVSATATPAVPSKSETGKPGYIAFNDNKNAATFSSTPLPGENTDVILSSKGAENRLVHSVAPKYPAEAHAEGTVLLKAVIDETGKVEGLRLIEGNATLATAAIQAVKQWRYRPYARDGKVQPFQTVVIVDFQKP